MVARTIAYGLRSTGYRLYDSTGNLLSWRQCRCRECQRFLPKSYGHDICEACAKKNEKEYRYNQYRKEEYKEKARLKSKIRFNANIFNIGDYI